MITAAPPARPPLPPADGGPAARRDPHPNVRGNPADPAWVRPAVLALLAATALLYLWRLGDSGWANDYYSAAVQAAATSWKAFFFGSSDASNFITVDKAPVFLWPMALTARLFGVNAWSILVPQAAEGVAAVGVLYVGVRRWFGPAAGLLAGAVLALTPVATLIFRFNNPDSLLVLLLTLAGYAVVRALESASTRWVVLAGALVGVAFLAKMLQAFLVVPGFALVYLVAAPAPLAARVRQVVFGFAAMVAAAGWWVAIVELWPASARPYIGGSQTNSVLELIFGYNGVGRLTGDEVGSVGGGPAGTAGRWGATGVARLFNDEYGGQASWLIPAALVLLVALLVMAGRAPRTDRTRAAALLWGGWLVVTGLAISLGQGIIHPYYTVALGPAIGALVGIGAVQLWARRDTEAARLTLAGVVAVTAWWAHTLLARTPAWNPSLRIVVLLGGLALAAVIALAPLATRRALAAVAAGTLLVTLAGPATYSWATAMTTHSGALPTAGPARTVGFPGGNRLGRPFTGVAGGGVGGGGGILDANDPSAEVIAYLTAGAADHRWMAAAVSSNQAAGYQLATGRPVMAIGGFNGTDPTPTLAQFQSLVAAGAVHYFIAAGTGGLNGNGAAASAITVWVEAAFPSATVDGVTVYDLTT
jgi:4-amino-4-deoxy-L-arabinose transferase-like glycosyltransferase